MSDHLKAIKGLYKVMEGDVHRVIDNRDRPDLMKKLYDTYQFRYRQMQDILDEWPEKEITTDPDAMLDFARWKWLMLDMQDLIDFIGQYAELPL